MKRRNDILEDENRHLRAALDNAAGYSSQSPLTPVSSIHETYSLTESDTVAFAGPSDIEEMAISTSAFVILTALVERKELVDNIMKALQSGQTWRDIADAIDCHATVGDWLSTQQLDTLQ